MLKYEAIQILMRDANIQNISAATIDLHGHITNINLSQTSSHSVEKIYNAASLSKAVFAYLVLRLIEINKSNSNILKIGHFFLPTGLDAFDLDTPLYKILPELLKSSDINKAKAITPRLILSHQTGIQLIQDNGPPKFTFEPGSEYGYDGYPFLYLQIALERLTGKTLETLAQSHVFRPLRMKNTTFLKTDFSQQAISPSFKKSLFPINPDAFASISANSLKTSATDYVKFLHAWLNDKSLVEAFESQISLKQDRWANDLNVPQNILDKIGWGLGLGVQTNHLGQVVRAFHSGDMDQWRSFFAMDLESKRCAVFFSDSPNGLLLTEALLSSFIEINSALKYINQKYGFEIAYTPNFAITQKENLQKIGNYLNTRRANSMAKFTEFLSTNLGFFKQLEKSYLIEHRHDDQITQEFYDRQFGLTIFKKN